MTDTWVELDRKAGTMTPIEQVGDLVFDNANAGDHDVALYEYNGSLTPSPASTPSMTPLSLLIASRASWQSSTALPPTRSAAASGPDRPADGPLPRLQGHPVRARRPLSTGDPVAGRAAGCGSQADVVHDGRGTAARVAHHRPCWPSSAACWARSQRCSRTWRCSSRRTAREALAPGPRLLRLPARHAGRRRLDRARRGHAGERLHAVIPGAIAGAGRPLPAPRLADLRHGHRRSPDRRRAAAAGWALLFDGLCQHGTPTTDRRTARAVQFHYTPADAARGSEEERLAVFGSEGKDVHAQPTAGSAATPDERRQRLDHPGD